MPMGAVIFADQYFMKKLGLENFFAEKEIFLFIFLLHWPGS